jgi:hypothetical protein
LETDLRGSLTLSATREHEIVGTELADALTVVAEAVWIVGHAASTKLGVELRSALNTHSVLEIHAVLNGAVAGRSQNEWLFAGHAGSEIGGEAVGDFAAVAIGCLLEGSRAVLTDLVLVDAAIFLEETLGINQVVSVSALSTTANTVTAAIILIAELHS